MLNRFVDFVKSLVAQGMELENIKTIIRDSFLINKHTQLTKGYMNTNDVFPIFDAEYEVSKLKGNDVLVFDEMKKAEMDELKDLIKAVAHRIVENDLEKGGKMPVGTVKNWGGKDYKKIKDGEWKEIKKEKQEGKKEEQKFDSTHKISHGSGVDSGKKVKVISQKEFNDNVKTNGRGVPEIEGHYKPVDWKKEHPIKFENGKYGTMHKERLTPLSEVKKPDIENKQEKPSFKVGQKVTSSPDSPISTSFRGQAEIISIEPMPNVSGGFEVKVKDDSGEVTKTRADLISPAGNNDKKSDTKKNKKLPEIKNLSSSEASDIINSDPEDLAEEYDLPSKYEAEEFQSEVMDHFNN